jgi:hypothetical protein
VRCPSGVVDGLRAKRKWPLNSFFFLPPLSFYTYYFSAGRGCPRDFSINVLAISDNSNDLNAFKTLNNTGACQGGSLLACLRTQEP